MRRRRMQHAVKPTAARPAADGKGMMTTGASSRSRDHPVAESTPSSTGAEAIQLYHSTLAGSSCAAFKVANSNEMASAMSPDISNVREMEPASAESSAAIVSRKRLVLANIRDHSLIGSSTTPRPSKGPRSGIRNANESKVSEILNAVSVPELSLGVPVAAMKSREIGSAAANPAIKPTPAAALMKLSDRCMTYLPKPDQ